MAGLVAGYEEDDRGDRCNLFRCSEIRSAIQMKFITVEQEIRNLEKLCKD